MTGGRGVHDVVNEHCCFSHSPLFSQEHLFKYPDLNRNLRMGLIRITVNCGAATYVEHS